ncbi:hypothetical protein MSP8887_04264 [Marinomonas spartinae]|uniref:Cache domain-containing protein n=1 Tax=Marinomonas spartinae TaxID=1792290 RepID=A0A1A8T6E3_9GAMM|nr:hypothetical protein [Marinomonas spartinae]SBS26647.1 hypothetical protein MSP8886_00662 [Marinomonas spartinae]SBS40240.1 hypothetical protein MSP8887_04264 [Marinomonas spartinae]
MKKALLFTTLISIPSILFANEFEGQLTELANTQVRELVSSPKVIEAVEVQNQRNAPLSQSDIDNLDQQWRAEVSSADQPLISKVLGNPLSAYLMSAQEKSDGLYTEIFIMDNKGLNVGQSSVTSDYWQGDEAKWQQTFLKGSGAIYVGDVEEDESTQTFQSQISYTISDPKTGEAIGAITVGVNIDQM